MSKLNLPDFNDWDAWIDAEEVTRKMGISKRTLQNWRTNKVLPYSYFKCKYYYLRSDVLKILKNNYNGKKGDCDE